MKAASKIFKFGRNELDLRTYELRRAGQRITLSRIPMDFLVLLLENRDRLVTRDEIAARLWPASESVDVVQGINTVVNRVRSVLNDDANDPRFIETVIGRGYRFISEVHEVEAPLSVPPNLNEAWPAENFPSSQEVSVVQSLPELAVSQIATPPVVPVVEEVLSKAAEGEWKTLSLSKSTWWILATAAAVCAVTGGVWFLNSASSKEAEPALQAVPFTSLSGSQSSPAFSPDGRRVAFVWNGEKGDNDDIYVQAADSSSPIRLTTNPARDTSPAWSRDGRQIAFLRKEDSSLLQIIIVPAEGGAERIIASVSSYFDQRNRLTWAPDGRHILVTDDSDNPSTGPIVSISIENGSKNRLTSPPFASADRAPSFSPDGRNLAFIRFDASAVEKLYIKSIESGTEREVPTGGTLLNSIAWMPGAQQIAYSLRSQTGYALWRVRLRDGVRRKLFLDARDARDVSVSASGRRLAYVEHVSNSDIWRYSTQAVGEPPTKLIASSRDDEDPQYSPDGKTIAFASTRSGPSEIWTCSSNGTNCLQITHTGSSLSGSPAWSLSGREIAFDSHLQGNTNIYVVPKEGGAMRRVTSGGAAHSVPFWSHDDRWIYFCWNRTGLQQIWKVPSGGGEATQVTTDGAFGGVEAPDGRSIYYLHSNPPVVQNLNLMSGKAMVIPELDALATVRCWELRGDSIYFVDASTQPSLHLYNLQTKRVTQLAPISARPLPDLRGLSVAPDGRSFLFVESGAGASNIMLIDNLSAN